MRILLTGFMGAGKTTVGRRLAERLDVPFLDLDEVVEEMAGKSVCAIFDSHGEEEFRRLEGLALEKVLELPHVVVATGGGTLVRAENAERARGRAVTVWLDTPIEVIERRLEHEGRADRPLYAEASEMRSLLAERLPAYRQADLTLECGFGDTVDEVVERLRTLLVEAECATS